MVHRKTYNIKHVKHDFLGHVITIKKQNKKMIVIVIVKLEASSSSHAN